MMAVSNFVSCELCHQYQRASDMALFLLRDKKLARTDEREWEGKAGVRHLCQTCVFQIMITSSPS